MFLRVESMAKKKLVGQHLEMSFSENRTPELWKGFMPRRQEIKNPCSTVLYSVQCFKRIFDYQHWDINDTFTKWAAVEVTDFSDIPSDMHLLTLPAGQYAVFLHTGTPADFRKTFDYIFNDWLPSSGYEIDDLPHFEVLDHRYKNNQPDSQEEIWIPVKKRTV